MSPSASSLLLFQLFSLVLMVVAMPTCQLEGSLVQDAYNLLRDLGGPLPVRCLQYSASFPSSAFPSAGSGQPQCHQTLRVIYETLNGAGQLFMDHDLPAGEGGISWDSKKLDDFQNLLFRLVEDGSCFSRVNSSEVLSSYFSSLTAVLQQEGSGCGWMLLRRDLLFALRSVLLHHRTCFSWSQTA